MNRNTPLDARSLWLLLGVAIAMTQSACQPTSSQSGAGAERGDLVSDAGGSDLVASIDPENLGSLMTQLLADRRNSQGADGTASPMTAALPDALDVQMDALAERWELFAVQEVADGRYRSGYVQIDRLRVSDSPAASESDWAFDSVISGLSVWVDASKPLPVVHRLRTTQRAALGLAGAEAQRIWVGRDALEVSRGPACDADYSVTEAPFGSGVWQLEQTHCPELIVLGDSALTESTALDMRRDAGDDHTGSGAGWVRHAWGAVPVGGSAVVFDRLWLALDDGEEIRLTRRQRRSGQGPVRIRAHQLADGVETPVETTHWEFDESANTAGTVAQPGKGLSVTDIDDATSIGVSGPMLAHSSSLRIDELGLAVDLSAIAGVPIISTGGERVWHGAVVARGTHTGLGFVRLTLPPPAH